MTTIMDPIKQSKAPGGVGENNKKEILISSSSDQVYDWKNYEKVTLTRWLCSLPPETISKSKQTLTSLTFTEYTLYKNVKRCLKNLENLKILSFSDVIIDAYHRFLYTKQIDVPSLSSLTISRSTKLTNSEFFLLDFFTRGANLKALSQFSLYEDRNNYSSGNNNGESSSSSSSHTAKKEDYEMTQLQQQQAFCEGAQQDHDAPLLARFLMKHHPTLKQIEVLGPNIWDPSKTKEQLVQNLAFIQLDTFPSNLSDPGQRLLLKHQNQLQHLSCTNETSLNKERLKLLNEAVSNNCKTLSSFRLECTTVGRGAEEADDDGGKNLKFDCKYFGRCKSLEILEVNLRTQETKDDGSPKKKNSIFVSNIHLLPHSLKRLVIKSESLAQLRDFFNHVTKVEELEYLHLEAINPYPFRLGWLQVLSRMQKLKYVRIDGAEIDESVRDVIEKRKDVRIYFNDMEV